MNTITVDTKKRIVLPGVRPGDVFDIRPQEGNRYLLVKIEMSKDTERMTRKACLDAMRKAPLQPAMAWEKLRTLTREL